MKPFLDENERIVPKGIMDRNAEKYPFYAVNDSVDNSSSIFNHINQLELF